jgi:tetratricopeptide (TPR) repeat protein
MPRLNPIALSVICALAMAGCASPARNHAGQPPAVDPVLSVQHAGVTAQGMYRLGRYMEAQGRYEQAIVAYRRALQRDPLLVEAYTGLGMSLAAQQRYDEAIRQFQAAVVLAPQAPHLHSNLGYAYLLSGATEQAVKALEEAQRLDPGHEKAAENLRLALAKLETKAREPARPAGATVSAPASVPASAPATLSPADPPAAGMSLVEVAPQIFELRTPPAPRNLEKIEAVPLAPLPQAKTSLPAMRGFKLEVSNGNGIVGLAKRVAGRLKTAGVQTTRLTNQQPFDQTRTEVQYRDGYAREAAALAATLQAPVRITPSNELARHIDVRLVLGKDVPSETAFLTSPPNQASNPPNRPEYSLVKI